MNIISNIKLNPAPWRTALFTGILFLLVHEFAAAACSLPSLPPDAVNVQDYGAVPDDSGDDTSSIQAAINDTSSGGTVYFPDGVYLVSMRGVSNPTAGLTLPSNITLFLATGAVIRAIPTDQSNLNWLIGIFEVNNVTITGGTIEGERAGHIGTTGAAGHNILLWNSQDINLIDLKTKDAWGDGISITGELPKPISENISICGVHADNNRRHGLSLIHANNVQVSESIFSNSNGADPESGIDFEPNSFPPLSGTVSNVTVSSTHIYGNHGNGIIFHGINGTVQNNTIQRSLIYDNVKKGVRMESADTITLYKNLFEDNGTDHIGWYPVLDLYNSSNIRVEKNSIRDASASLAQDGIMLRGTSIGNVITDNDICVDSPNPIHDKTTDHAYSVSLTTFCTRLPHSGSVIWTPGSNITLAHLSLLLRKSASPDTTDPVPGDSGTLATSDITTTSLTINWSKATDDQSSQASLEYILFYSTADNIDTVADCEANGIAVDAYTADSSSKAVSGLTSSTTYYFNVVVRDEAGNKAAYSRLAQATN